MRLFKPTPRQGVQRERSGLSPTLGRGILPTPRKVLLSLYTQKYNPLIPPRPSNTHPPQVSLIDAPTKVNVPLHPPLGYAGPQGGCREGGLAAVECRSRQHRRRRGRRPSQRPADDADAVPGSAARGGRKRKQGRRERNGGGGGPLQRIPEGDTP